MNYSALLYAVLPFVSSLAFAGQASPMLLVYPIIKMKCVPYNQKPAPKNSLHNKHLLKVLTHSPQNANKNSSYSTKAHKQPQYLRKPSLKKSNKKNNHISRSQKSQYTSEQFIKKLNKKQY